MGAPAAEIGVAVENEPPGGRMAAWIWNAGACDHRATTSPPGATATDGSMAPPLGSDRVEPGSHAGAASAEPAEIPAAATTRAGSVKRARRERGAMTHLTPA